MSFFLSPFGNDFPDPFFGSLPSASQLNGMMQNMMYSNGFRMMQSPPALPPVAVPGLSGLAGLILPFNFPSLEIKFDGLALPPGNGHSFSSSTVMKLSNGPDGRPQVYQAHTSTRTAPGGVRETKKAECDSRSGVKKLAIGHHIGERAHIVEKSRNYISGEQEEHEELINISEDEAEDFNREFQEKVRRSLPEPSRGNQIQFVQPEGYLNIDTCNQRLALPPALPPNTSGSKTAAKKRGRQRKRQHESEVDESEKAAKIAKEK